MMTRLLLPLLLALVLPLGVTSKGARESGSTTSNLQRLSRAHLEFALSLFRQVTKGSEPLENVVLSPFSVASVLSQLWLGTGVGSPTALELEQVLRYKESGLTEKKVHQVFHSSLETLEDPDFQSVVKQGNALFVQNGLTVEPTYLSDLRHYYNSTVEQVDFEGGLGAATDRVNSWVNKKTQGLIPTLLEMPLPKDTKFLAVNAIALKAFWKHSFDPTRTASNGIFHRDANTKLEIPMMSGKFKVLLSDSPSLGCRLLELPFRGKRLSMFILLPDENTAASGVRALEGNLTAGNLKKLFSSLREETVNIRMPRFRVTQSSRLADSLITLGLSSVFDPSHANFSRIVKDPDEKLSVSSLAHRVTLELTEKGAHAAAATALGIERFGEVGEFFEINRPFLFFIWDYHSGAVLFIGRIATPEPLVS